MPPHYWIVVRGSSCKQKEKDLKEALGDDGDVVHVWKGRKKQDRCYAVVAGAVEKIPGSMIVKKQSVVVEGDDDLDEAD